MSLLATVTASVTPAAAATRSVATSSAQFDVVVRWPEQASDTTRLRILVADFTTSAPLPPGAEIALSFTGPAGATTSAKGIEPGIFEAEAALAPGRYTLTLTIVAPGKSDVLLLEGVDIGPGVVPVEAPPESEVPVLWLVLAIVGALLFGLLGFLAGRHKAAAAVAIGALLLPIVPMVPPPTSHAHGGEDHGAPVARPVGEGAVRLPLEAQFLLGLHTGLASDQDVHPRLRVTGKVTTPPEARVTLSWPHTARIESAGAFMRVGQRVTKGEVLATLVELPDPGDRLSLGAERVRASAQIAASAARVKAARQERDRKRALAELVSAQELADAEATLAVAQGELDAARATVRALSEGGALEMPLVAPIDGVIAAVNAAPGAYVAADQPIATLVDATQLWVEGALFETDLTQVDLAANALVRTDTPVDTQVLTATPISASPIIDPVTRTQAVVFALAPTDATTAAPTLGQAVTLELALREAPAQRDAKLDRAPPDEHAAHELTTLPRSALVDIDGRPMVWLKTGPERFESVPVAVIAEAGELARIQGDLHPGQRIVVDGAAFLRGAAPFETP